MTKKYGILAYPAKHSLSPVMHNAAFKALAFDAEYGVFEVPENELPSFMEQVKHEPIDGLSVSLPYKEVMLNYMNEVDDDAKKIGAVNTVVNRGGFLYGYNTDFLGSNRALEEVCGDLSGRKVVVLGAGGAARAIIYGLIKEGAEVLVVNRNKEKADLIVSEFSEIFGRSVSAGLWGEKADGDIFIQSSSIWVGREGADIGSSEPFFCDPDYLKNFEIVMDIHYVPLITPLLKVAQGMGRKVVTGDKMLLYQAAEQFKLWTGKEAPIEVMRAALIVS